MQMVRAVALTWFLIGSVHMIVIGQAMDRPRVVVTTDGEIDDRSSFVRFLMHSNDYDVQAIVATNSIWQKNGRGAGWILDMIDLYDEVFANLTLHDDRYPSPDTLRRMVFIGNEDHLKMHEVGPLNDSPGSEQIVRVLLRDDPRPVWLLAWGGTNTIAQALWRLKTSLPDSLSAAAFAKTFVYAIAFQDETTPWIRNNLPEVTLILSYQYVAMNYEHKGHPLSNAEIFDPEWMTENVKEGHGPLGAAYPQNYFSEGDSPTFLHLVDNGLRSAEDPSFGGWGGRFESKSAGHPSYWTDAKDDGDKLKPLWRWLPAISRDFAARMDWGVMPFEGANHPPRVVVRGGLNRTVLEGQTVHLDARATSDPDGDAIEFRWWQYADADTYPENVVIENAAEPRGSFVAPAVDAPQTIHIVLFVRDAGVPSLTRYSRIIFTILPDD